jgi:signal transduction histidine kinase
MLTNQISVQLQMMLNVASRLMQENRKRIMESEKWVDRTTILLLLLLIITVAGALLFTSNRIVRSIYSLTEATGLIAAKRWDHKVPVTGDDEIGRLAQDFNEMAAKLNSSYGALEMEITERKRADKMLRTYSAKLENLNRDLEDFTSIAAHDLQEPLRKVQIFGDMLAVKCGASLDDTCRDYINRMQTAAERMHNLLNSLLAYSRVTATTEPIKETDLGKSVEAALSNLEIPIKEKSACVEIGDLPTVRADRVQMIQLFQNLIGNALKYSRDGQPPHVKIYTRPSEESSICEICVEDNGIGFDEKYLDKIFLPFQRLQRRSDYEGVGIGLAICRKIMERHAGEITARSESGKGATFIVSLPGR